MLKYAVKRSLVAVPVLIGISVLAFLLVRLSPSDPVSMMLSPEQAGNEEFVAYRRTQLGLDKSIFHQYVSWARAMITGDFGFSFQNGRAVTTLIGERLMPTTVLMAASLGIAIVVGLVLGVASAIWQNTWVDYLASVFAVIAISIPGFFLALASIFVFSLVLGILPPAGMRPRGGDSGFFEMLPYLAMPATILGLTIAGPFVRYVRAGMLEVLNEDYLRTADAKGVRSSRVLTRHALRNALIPLVTVVTLQVPTLFGGAVIIESIYSWPGLGTLVLTAISARDYPVLVGFMVAVAVLVVLFNLIADLLYGFLDPRIRYE